jgi:hypothetical protein
MRKLERAEDGALVYQDARNLPRVVEIVRGVRAIPLTLALAGFPPGIAPGWPAYRAGASLKVLCGHRKWSARDDLHVQGCLILSQVGLLFPVNHAPRNWRP